MGSGMAFTIGSPPDDPEDPEDPEAPEDPEDPDWPVEVIGWVTGVMLIPGVRTSSKGGLLASDLSMESEKLRVPPAAKPLPKKTSPNICSGWPLEPVAFLRATTS